jgi:hypothetical protein
MINEISEFLTMDVLCLIPYILELWNCHHRFYIPFPAKPNFGIYHAIFVNTSVFSSLSLASIILEYISCSLWTFEFFICCSLCFCKFLLTVEKFSRAIIKSAETIVAEINGTYVRNGSIFFHIVLSGLCWFLFSDICI